MRAAELGLERSPQWSQFDIEATNSEDLEASIQRAAEAQAECASVQGPITDVCRMKSYTSQRAASLEEGRGQPEKGWPSRPKGLGREDEVFIVLFDYSGVVMIR